MEEQKKNPFRFLIGILWFVILIWIYLNYKDDPERADISWKGTAFEWSERAIQDSNFVASLKDTYIELEGVLLNVVYSQGAATLYFTSGLQTDTCYFVGQQPEWKTLNAQAVLSRCDSLIVSYGRNYNLKPAIVGIEFSGDVFNDDDDTLLNFSYFDACDYTISKRHEYRLHNFCNNKITVRAKFVDIEKEEKEISVELDKVLILSNEKNHIRVQD